MKMLLKLCAALESATGCAFIGVPNVVVKLLLGAEVSGVGLAASRVAGMGLLSLGIACWPSRAAGNSHSEINAMLTYNALVALYFLRLGIGGEWVGKWLWPAVVLHVILTILLLWARFRKVSDE